jgi:hypothetical protein
MWWWCPTTRIQPFIPLPLRTLPQTPSLLEESQDDREESALLQSVKSKTVPSEGFTFPGLENVPPRFFWCFLLHVFTTKFARLYPHISKGLNDVIDNQLLLLVSMKQIRYRIGIANFSPMPERTAPALAAPLRKSDVSGMGDEKVQALEGPQDPSESVSAATRPGASGSLCTLANRYDRHV